MMASALVNSKISAARNHFSDPLQSIYAAHIYQGNFNTFSVVMFSKCTKEVVIEVGLGIYGAECRLLAVSLVSEYKSWIVRVCWAGVSTSYIYVYL